MGQEVVPAHQPDVSDEKMARATGPARRSVPSASTMAGSPVSRSSSSTMEITDRLLDRFLDRPVRRYHCLTHSTLLRSKNLTDPYGNLCKS
jgi:hypothetical protein